MKPIFGVRVLVAVCLLATAAIAQRNISVGSPVTENFDSLLGAGSPVIANNTSGFYSSPGTSNTFTLSNGGSGTGGFYNFGTTAATDRAAGSVVDATRHIGIRLLNNSATPITSLRVVYAGETWRGGTGGEETITFSYQPGTITDLSTGTWTNVPLLNYTPTTGTNGPLDGNVVRSVLDQTISVNVAPGTEIMLRWTMSGGTGQRNGLAVDDLVVAANPTTAGDATISGRVTDSYGRAISSAIISVTDLAGNKKIVYTNTFGYYSVPELEVGQSYVVSVSARRYTFANPSMVISLTDSVAGANFVASR
jgi:hypothetical protein